MSEYAAPAIENESDILDEAKRKQLIEHWNSSSNQCRKDEAFKAYECLKDKTNNYVMELLLKQFSYDTVVEMQYAITNISVLRKVIDKLAKVYANGAKRTMPGKEGDGELESQSPDTKALDELVWYLGLDEAMTKCNRYYRTFKNALAFPKPVNNGEGKYDVQIEILPPFLYDAVESPYDPKKPLAIVLSDYSAKRKTLYYLGDAGVAGRTGQSHVENAPVNQVLNTNMLKDDSKSDSREWVWWSKNYHFVTDVNGKIKTSSDDLETEGKNPILTLPFVNFAGEQDNSFWAEGGRDLVESGIQINVDLSNYRNIGTTQGYGQLYMTGKNLPKSVKVGPQHCVQLEWDKDNDPQPQIGFLNANAPMSEMKEGIEMFVALMLSTNNLSTSNFAASLNGGSNFSAGISMMIDKSESIEDINDQAKIFIHNEPMVLDIAGRWLEAYKADLTDEAKALRVPKNLIDEQVSFPPSQILVSEADKLATLKLRKELGLNSNIELVQRDNPGMTVQEAQMKLDRIKADQSANGVAPAHAVNPDGTPADPTAVGAEANVKKDVVAAQVGTDIQKQALNGAQVSSLVEIVVQVASGTVPRDSAVRMVAMAFQISDEEADRLIGTAGKSFTPTTPPPAQGGFTG